MSLSWSPTASEVAAAARHRQRWRWRAARVVAVGVSVAWGLSLVDDLGWLGGLGAVAVGGTALLYGVWRAPRVAAERQAPWPIEALTVAAEGVVHQTGGLRVEVPWPGVGAPEARPEGLYLALPGGRSVFVPRRVLPEALATQVAAWKAGGRPRVAAAGAPYGCDVHVVRFRATFDDYVAFARRLDARRGLSAGPYAAGALLIGALLADRGLDLLTLIAVVSWTLLLALSGGLRRGTRRWVVPLQVRRQLARDPERLPRGAVTAGLGPEGGWLASDGGESRFAWHEVRHVDADDVAIVLLYGDELGTVLPVRAFGSAEAMAAVRLDIERWRRGAIPPSVTPRGQAPPAPPPVFAPPGGA